MLRGTIARIEYLTDAVVHLTQSLHNSLRCKLAVPQAHATLARRCGTHVDTILRPRMRSAIHLLEAFHAGMRLDLRGAHARVPQQFLHGAEVGAAVVHLAERAARSDGSHLCPATPETRIDPLAADVILLVEDRNEHGAEGDALHAIVDPLQADMLLAQCICEVKQSVVEEEDSARRDALDR
jgi:hypothetical protein